MPLALAALLPHPAERDAAAVPKCMAAAASVGAELAKAKVGTVIVVQSAPFAPTDAFTPPAADPRAVNVLGLDKVSSGGAAFDVDVALIDELTQHARPAGWAVKRLPQIEFDTAALAALDELKLQTLSPKLVIMTLPYRPPADLVDLGLLIGSLAAQTEGVVALVVVANLASRLSGETAKAEARQFDEAFKNALKANDLTPIVSYDLTALEAAGEEAARPLGLIHGMVSGGKLVGTLRAYEAPSTTGYAVVTWS